VVTRQRSDERFGRPALGGDVQEKLTDHGIASAATDLMNERANLLVARPVQPELFGNRGYASVRLRDRTLPVVELRNRRYEASVEAGCATDH
jgi:hypothetical protein